MNGQIIEGDAEAHQIVLKGSSRQDHAVLRVDFSYSVTDLRLLALGRMSSLSTSVTIVPCQSAHLDNMAFVEDQQVEIRGADQRGNVRCLGHLVRCDDDVISKNATHHLVLLFLALDRVTGVKSEVLERRGVLLDLVAPTVEYR